MFTAHCNRYGVMTTSAFRLAVYNPQYNYIVCQSSIPWEKSRLECATNTQRKKKTAFVFPVVIVSFLLEADEVDAKTSLVKRVSL